MLAAALDYVGRGIPVFPVRQDKRPLTTHGFKDATCDEEMIRAWWQKWADAGIGVPTGVASAWLVLDSDPRHGGDASLTELIEAYGDLPDTLEQETGGGGHHIVFDYPELAQLGNSRGRLPEGLDVRGEGGYIVVAPSLHASGRRYRWRNGATPAPIPEWLLKLLTEEKRIADSPTDERRTQAESVAIGSVIIEGQRDSTLFRRVACPARGRGANSDEIIELLREANARCVPPLTEKELEHIARSAMRYKPEAEKRNGIGA